MIRQRSVQAANWQCDFDVDRRTPPNDGCLRARTLSDTCEPWKGIKLVLRDHNGQELKRAYSGDSGSAELCGIPPGKYRLEGSAPRLPTAASDIEVGRRGPVVFLSLAHDQDREFLATFTVARRIKGPKLNEITVRSWKNDGSCGFGGFEAGRSYEVFARSEKGANVVGLCGGTKLIEGGAVDAGQ